MPLLPSQRHLFDIPREIAYFNAAYYSPQLNESRDRLIAGVKAKSQAWQRIAPGFFDDAEAIRTLAARLFGADGDAYAIIPAASYGLSTAARAVEPRLRSGDRILVIEEEFPSNVLPFRRVAGETAASMLTVPAPPDRDWARAVVAAMDKTVKVVAISTCHWTNGSRIDLGPISDACRDYGSMLVIDATQTLGAVPFDLPRIRPDFLVAASYKWMLGPYGSGLLYVSEAWRDARPLEENWLARDNAADFTSLARYSDNYRPGARRFDVGETGVLTLLPGVIAALEQIEAWGIPNVAASLEAINSRISSHLQGLGFTLPPEASRSPHMFGARLPASYQGNLVAELKKRDIYISQREGALRFAPHLWVDDHDIARLLGALDELIR